MRRILSGRLPATSNGSCDPLRESKQAASTTAASNNLWRPAGWPSRPGQEWSEIITPLGTSACGAGCPWAALTNQEPKRDRQHGYQCVAGAPHYPFRRMQREEVIFTFLFLRG